MITECIAYFLLTMQDGSQMEVVGNDSTNYEQCVRVSQHDEIAMKKDILKDKSIIFKDAKFLGCSCSGRVGKISHKRGNNYGKN